MLASPLGHSRIGIIVPKYRHTAVDRNRLKRRMRELVRQILLPTGGSFDLSIRASPDAYAVTFAALRASVLALVPRISVTLHLPTQP